MGYKDLREFITKLEEIGELQRIEVQVDGNLELGALMRRVYEVNGPACLFENVKGSKFRFFSGAFLGQKKFAAAIGSLSDFKFITDKLLMATRSPIPPVLVTSGQCKENIDTGDKINIERFPAPKWHHLDGGRYIGTLGVLITKDPDTGNRNMAVIRHQVMGKNKIGADLMGQHTGINLQKYRAKNSAMPFATAIGVPPEVVIAAVMKPPYGQDELGVAGAIAGEPIPLVKCETVDLEVPASAEIVLEGEVPLDTNLWEPEGPFGEFPGHFSTLKTTQRPTGYLSAVTYRDDPIEQGCSPGLPPSELSSIEEKVLTVAAREELLRAGIPGVKDVYATEMGCGFTVIVSMDRHYYMGNARQIIFCIFQAVYLSKWVIVVDSDIDIRDRGQVEWALSVRVQPHRDIIITDDRCRSNPLDPSINPDLKKPSLATQGSKIGIDATIGYKGFEFPPVVRTAEEQRKQVEARWKEYGFR